MSTIKEAIAQIRKFITDKCEGSPQRLAVDSGLHRNSLNNFAAKDWNPTSSTIEAVLAQIDKELRELAAGAKRQKKPNKKAKSK